MDDTSFVLTEEETRVADVAALTSVKNRVVVITGAAQGIGRALARAFAAAGAIPVVADLNEAKARSVVAEIEGAKGKAIAIAADIGDAASMNEVARQTHKELGRIDVLINNAGIFSTLAMRPFEEIPDEEWDRVIHVNVSGVMLSCRAVLPHMRAAGWGRIINVSSASILLGRPNYLHYTTSKSALIGMTRSMAREVGKFGITVNVIMPGAVVTEIPRQTVTPEQRTEIIARQSIPRSQVPEDLVGLMLFLASEGSRFMTGQTLNVDGGASHI